jgi:hypothetical protein
MSILKDLSSERAFLREHLAELRVRAPDAALTRMSVEARLADIEHQIEQAGGEDPLGFGVGNAFDSGKLLDFLRLRDCDILRVADVPIEQVVRPGGVAEVPRARECLEAIAATCNLVAEIYDGDAVKTRTWFMARNPLLGDVSPRDMICWGRFERLQRFLIGAVTGQAEAV